MWFSFWLKLLGRTWITAIVVQLTSIAWACDTPVYRYAMYRWEPAPYEIYLFHRGAVDEEHVRLQQQLEGAVADEQRRANLVTFAVNLDEDAELKAVPPDVRRVWQAQPDPAVPAYMIVTPQGVPLFTGRLDEAAIGRLLESPLRRQLAKELESGKAAVLVLLTSGDQAANQAAEKMLAELVADVAAEKVELFSAPRPENAPSGKPADSAAKPAAKIEIGLLTLARDNAKERWLIEALLSIEDDLRSEDLQDHPMVFAVYGRGRALPPYVGPGVTRDNLIDCIEFVTGACSCTVKEQNPGLDLLVRHDWLKAAETLAARFGAEEGNESQLTTADFFPDLIIPVASGETKPASEPAKPTTGSEAPTADLPAADAGDATQEGNGSSRSAEHAAAVGPDEESHSGTVVITETKTLLIGAGDFFANPVIVIGAGLALGFVLLFGLTFLVLRPR